VEVTPNGQRERRTIHGTEQDAKELVKYIHKQELAGVNVVEAVRAARVATAPASSPAWPRLRDDVPAFVEYQVSVGEWTGETPISYRRTLEAHVFDFQLSDGQVLGDLAVDQVTAGMLREVLDVIRRSRKSLALQERIRSRLRAYYRHLRKRRGFTGQTRPPPTSLTTCSPECLAGHASGPRTRFSSRVRDRRCSGGARPTSRAGYRSSVSRHSLGCVGARARPSGGRTLTLRGGRFTSRGPCATRRARSKRSRTKRTVGSRCRLI